MGARLNGSGPRCARYQRPKLFKLAKFDGVTTPSSIIGVPRFPYNLVNLEGRFPRMSDFSISGAEPNATKWWVDLPFLCTIDWGSPSIPYDQRCKMIITAISKSSHAPEAIISQFRTCLLIENWMRRAFLEHVARAKSWR